MLPSMKFSRRTIQGRFGLHVPSCIIMYALLCTIMYHHAPRCTFMYIHVPIVCEQNEGLQNQLVRRTRRTQPLRPRYKH